MTIEHPNPAYWWKHRRTGYYAGMVWAAVQTPAWMAIEWKKPGTVAAMGAVIGWSYGISATLIISYFGNTTAETIITKGKTP